jgi:carboxylate-amine ligase
MKPPELTLGIEEEYQIIDPETRELRSYITEILQPDGTVSIAEIKPELHQSVVEVGSVPCHTPADLKKEVIRLRGLVKGLAAKSGLRFAAAATHPFSSWHTQEITPLERYLGVAADLQDLARKNLVFGTHVHVGIEDKEFMIDAMNVARYFMPHILCLSSSSPFWMGRNTGLKSYRTVIWKNFPRTGTPPYCHSWSDYRSIEDTLVKTGAIEDGSKIWWDIRPHWKYPTLEFRFCDMATKVDEAVCLAAILQAIVAKLWKLRRDNMTFRVYRSELIDENKWRAVRYGLDGNLLDLGEQTQKPARELIRELIEWFLDDVLDELGSRTEVEYAFKILEEGSSADRQLRTFEETGDLKAVVDQLIAETSEGVDDQA